MRKYFFLFTLLTLPMMTFGYAHTYPYNSHHCICKHIHRAADKCMCKNAHKANHYCTCKKVTYKSKNTHHYYAKAKAKKVPLYQQMTKFDFYLSGGAALSSIKNDTSVQINNTVVNSYITDTATRTGPFGGIGIGKTFQEAMGKPINASLALMGYYVGFNEINGTEYPLSNDATYDTLDYTFKAESFAAMLESRIAYNNYNFRPFLLLGIGASWNYLFNYNETPTNPSGSAAPVPNFFENNTNTAFAYEVGAGIQYELPHIPTDKFVWSLALEYRYMNMGKGELAPFPAATANNGLTVAALNMQAALLTLQISG